MGLVLSGISVSKGIAIGKAYQLQHDEVEVSEFIIPRPLLGEEVARYRAALQQTRQQLKIVRKRVVEHASADIAGFVDAHLLMLKDSQLVDEPIRIIKSKQCNAEWALKLQRDMLIAAFEEMDDPYLSARKDDVNYVVECILRNLLDQPDMARATQSRWLKGGIIIADEVSPEEVIALHQLGVAALVTEFGGLNSHTAILARSLALPTIVGVRFMHRYIQQNDLLIIDGSNGVVCAAPDKIELKYYRHRQASDIKRQQELESLREQPAITIDGCEISLQSNLELEEDLGIIQKYNSGGIGLFRTEMLFMNRRDLPDEEEQFQFYARVVRAMKGAPVTIRTLDIGADKQLEALSHSVIGHANPALGLRAIRLCLKDPELFLPQIRAILRASALGQVRIMIPLLTTVHELLQVIHILEEQKQLLQRRKIAVDNNIPLGGMVEVPAAAVMADVFAGYLDFLSIGTNDLIQYTLAADRMDDEVNYLFDPLHPAVLRLIHMTIKAGKAAGIPVSMCGEMAGDPRFTRLLLGLGLQEFSMQSVTMLEVKHIINTSDRAELMQGFACLSNMHLAEDIGRLVDQFNNRVAGELV
jgi:phosphotransferase system enzyme I (PtsI)